MQNSEYQEVEIEVTKPDVHKQHMGGIHYCSFTLVGQDSKGFINIKRTTTDFDLFRKTLIKKWPGFYFPSLQSTRLSAEHSPEQLLEGAKQYTFFLKHLGKKPFIWTSEPVQFFVKIDTMSCTKVLQSFAKGDLSEILYEYRTLFKDAKNCESSQAGKQVAQFHKELTSLNHKLDYIRKQFGEELLRCQIKQHKKYNQLHHSLPGATSKKQAPPQLQETVAGLGGGTSDNPSNLPPSAPETVDDLKSYSIQQFRVSINETPLRLLVEELKQEKAEVEAFMAAIKERNYHYERQVQLEGKISVEENRIVELQQGKKQSLLNKIRKFSLDDKPAKHETAIQKYREQIEEQKELCEYIDNVLALEIKQFRKLRLVKYYEVVKHFLRAQLVQMQQEKASWQRFYNCCNEQFGKPQDINQIKTEEKCDSQQESPLLGQSFKKKT